MSRSLRYDIPGTDWRRGLTEAFDSAVFGLFEPEVPAPFDLVVEIGFGRGEFLLDMAAKHPEKAYLGVEVSFKRVLKMARKVARARLENVRLVEGRGEVVIQDCLPAGSVAELWINFSDPWPKAAHARRRVVQADVVHFIAKALRPGGVLHVATDDVPYAMEIDEVLRGESLLENLHAPKGWLPEVPGRTPTSYELDWRSEGRSLHFFDYARREEALADLAGIDGPGPEPRR
jgi:tRNA (guanine-N7-)-methyltransferase